MFNKKTKQNKNKTIGQKETRAFSQLLTILSISHDLLPHQ